MNRLVKGFILFFTLLCFGGISAGIWFYSDYQTFLKAPLNFQEKQIYHLKKGKGIHALAQDLEQKGWIKQRYYLHILAKLEGQQYHNLKAGNYVLKQGIKPLELLKLLASGKTIQYQLTLLEGWNIKKVLSALAKTKKIKPQLNLKQNIMLQIEGKKGHPEGQFFPDTYAFSENTTDIQFLKRSHQKMQHILAQEWANRAPNLPLKTPYEALILASIVEKESARANERALIAGVFTTRLKKGMRLQTDPTVIYGMGAEYKGNIRRKDLRKDTPYNTYTRKGLPPTPICMVGKEALQATLHPKEDGSLYFVAKGRSGTHYFSKTLKEHNRAVRKYQLNQ